MRGTGIVLAFQPEHFMAGRELFEEYAAQLAVDLCFQDFDQELNTLESMYAIPDGALFLSFSAQKAIACVAYRRHDQVTCEMKRLYVRQAYRRHGIARQLVAQALHMATDAGYQRMVLDTLPDMHAAQALYQSLGFSPVVRQQSDGVHGLVYYDYDLSAARF